MGIDTLSPEDSFRFFDLPTTTYVTLVNGTTQFLNGNPRRVAILIGNPGSQTFSVGVDPGQQPNQGLQTPSGYGPLMITHEQFGALVQVPWFVSASVGGGTFTVIEVVLREWPRRKGSSRG